MSRNQGADARASAEWWAAVVAGDTDEPHPAHGHNVSIRIRDGVAILSGRLLREEDRQELIRQARTRVGRGLRDVDASRLRLEDQSTTQGVLDQTLIAAYPDGPTAHQASRFVLKHASLAPLRNSLLEPGAASPRGTVPADYLDEVKKRLARGEAIVVMCVDETSAFEVRELMEEETRSTWVVAAPPELAAPAGR